MCKILCSEGLAAEVQGFGFVRIPLKHATISGNFDSITRQIRLQSLNIESALRKAKLLKQTRESGEEERIAESTDKWRDVIGQVIPRLKEHLNQECSMRRFVDKVLKLDVKSLGIVLDEYGEGGDEDVVSEYETDTWETMEQDEPEKENYYFCTPSKRAKYYEE